MILIEIAHPAGALDGDDHAILTGRIVAVMLNTDHTPEETMRRARRMTHITFRELTTWNTGDGVWRPGTGDPGTSGEAPPLIITVTVPEAWREDVSRHMIGLIRAAVRRVDTRHGWSRVSGDLWINVTGVSEGSIGLDGKASTSNDVLDALTADYRAAVAAGTAAPVPEGKLVDPICGMLVTPGPTAITWDEAGTTMGFCSEGCREAYRVRESVG